MPTRWGMLRMKEFDVLNVVGNFVHFISAAVSKFIE
jgi:hypothetical protein